MLCRGPVWLLHLRSVCAGDEALHFALGQLFGQHGPEMARATKRGRRMGLASCALPAGMERSRRSSYTWKRHPMLSKDLNGRTPQRGRTPSVRATSKVREVNFSNIRVLILPFATTARPTVSLKVSHRRRLCPNRFCPAVCNGNSR